MHCSKMPDWTLTGSFFHPSPPDIDDPRTLMMMLALQLLHEPFIMSLRPLFATCVQPLCCWRPAALTSRLGPGLHNINLVLFNGAFNILWPFECFFKALAHRCQLLADALLLV